MPKPKGQLLKRWNDWSAGVGHLVDDGRTPGMLTASAILGLRGELRPAPFQNSVTVDTEAGEHFQYYFEEPLTTNVTPAFVGASNDKGDSTAITVSHTVGSGDNRGLFVLVSADENTAPSSVTFGSDTLTLAGGNTGVSLSSRLYFLANPTAGAGTVTVNYAAATAAVVGVIDLTSVDQSNPIGGSNGTTGSGLSPSITTTTNDDELIIAVVAVAAQRTFTAGTNETERHDDNQSTDVSGWGCTQAGSDGGVINPTISGSGTPSFAISAFSIVGSQPGPSYLYVQRGKKSISSSTVKVNKISLAKADFANLETGTHDLTPLTIPGQPVRHSGTNTTGLWYFPMGDNRKPRELTTIAAGAVSNDTLAATATALGADHFANLGSQVVATLKHSSNDDGGMRILKVAGDVDVEADWGSPFGTGDRAERSGGVIGLAGLSFVLGVDGLYSFDKNARSRLVFEDFRSWRHVFDNIPITPYKGGLVFSHPTGLIFYEPGKLPVNIGLNADIGGFTLVPEGPGELRGGRYHGLAVAGDFLWTIYQPDISSLTANVMVGYPREQSPIDMIWQQLGTTNLQDMDHMLDCFVSVSSKPLSTKFVTPVLWYGDDDDLRYIVLSPTGSPFRTRTDTHKLPTTGDAYMSELRFTEPVILTELIIHTSNDMVSGDEWQISIIPNGSGTDTDIGPPAKGSGTRHKRGIDRPTLKKVNSLVLRVNWTGTSTADRLPPVIQAIELYGMPAIGEVE